MPYIDYEEYFTNGGTAQENAFPTLERLAEKKLDYWTQNRVKEIMANLPAEPPDELPEETTEGAQDETISDIKLAMTLIINALEKAQGGDKVSSFSNDGVSVSFEKTDDTANLYQQVIEVLPKSLTHLWV